MGNFIFTVEGQIILAVVLCFVLLAFVPNVAKAIVSCLVAILTILFLLLADAIALVAYPIWAWRNPCEASQSNSLASVLNWSWLIDLVNQSKSLINSLVMEFFQCIMRPIDSFVVKVWNEAFLHYAPMKKRRFFIDALGYDLNKLPENVQREYFVASDYDRQTYLIKNSMLSTNLVKRLFDTNSKIFVETGRVSDEQFSRLCFKQMEEFADKFDLSLSKQKLLISEISRSKECLRALHRYIMRKGLHPMAVVYFYEYLKKIEKPSDEILKIPQTMQFRQDLVTVMQTEAARNEAGTERIFADYLRQRKCLGYTAQITMSPWQYEVFHKLGLKMQPNTVCYKLTQAGKSPEAEKFAHLLIKYGECADNEVALSQIAANEKLSSLWLKSKSSDK